MGTGIHIRNDPVEGRWKRETGLQPIEVSGNRRGVGNRQGVGEPSRDLGLNLSLLSFKRCKWCKRGNGGTGERGDEGTRGTGVGLNRNIEQE